MKLGANNSVNQETKRVRVKLMDGDESRIKRPTGHPSNPIERVSANLIAKLSETENENLGSNVSEKPTDNHKTLKFGVFIAAAASAFLIYTCVLDNMIWCCTWAALKILRGKTRTKKRGCLICFAKTVREFFKKKQRQSCIEMAERWESAGLYHLIKPFLTLYPLYCFQIKKIAK